MIKVIKLLNDDNIEISRYVSPEARFFNPCIDIHNDYDKYESYCDFKEVINPFKMYAENERLNSIIKEVREYIEEWQKFPHTNGSTHKELKNLIDILDKENKCTR